MKYFIIIAIIAMFFAAIRGKHNRFISIFSTVCLVFGSFVYFFNEGDIEKNQYVKTSFLLSFYFGLWSAVIYVVLDSFPAYKKFYYFIVNDGATRLRKIALTIVCVYWALVFCLVAFLIYRS